MNKKTAGAIIIASLIFTGCGSKDSDNSSIETVKVPGKSHILYSKVSKLRVRKTPDMNTDEFTILAKGDKVIFFNEQTVKKFNVTLRGKNYNEPMVKIRLKNGDTGWIYGGALSKTFIAKDREVYKMTGAEPGDNMCYVTLVIDNKTIEKGAVYDICSTSAKYLNKKVMITGTKVVNVNDCESSEPCGKTKKVRVITSLKVVN